MGVFQRKKEPSPPPILRHLSSAISAASAVSSASTSKGKKKSDPGSLIRKISGRSDPGVSEVLDRQTARMERKLTRRIQKFRDDHPLLMKVGSALMVAGGMSAASIPAILAAWGIKLVVVGAVAGTAKLAVLSSAAAMTTTTATAASSGVAAAGAKMVLGGVAMDVGGRAIKAAKHTRSQERTPTLPSSVLKRREGPSDMYVLENRLTSA